MLVLGRKQWEKVYIDIPEMLGGIPTGIKHRVTVSVRKIEIPATGKLPRVLLAFEGPPEVIFTREELDKV